MAGVIPFRGILYDARKVSGRDVTAPPYDIITTEMRGALYKKSPYNIVRIDSGMEIAGDNEKENKYLRAAACLREWLNGGILIRSTKPCFYAYEVGYRMGGQDRKLRGLFGLVRLVELGKGVYPHEETHSKPKADRLRLMTTCEANTSPIFSLYNSPEKIASKVIERVSSSEPFMEAEDPDRAVHRLWPIDKDSDITAVVNDLADKAIYIADGHHRYETALEYRRIMAERAGVSSGEEPFNYVLMFLANIAEGDLTILPAHRIIRHAGEGILYLLSGHFEIKTIPADDDIMDAIRGRSQTLGFYSGREEKQYVLRYKGGGLKGVHPSLKNLDVTILHELVLKDILKTADICYEMDPVRAKDLVKSGGYDAVFFLNPTKVEDVERVALSSVRMPPKSTYFYPKVMTGFIINSFKN
jgi:uncharacterized protein (DUF1015 family)